MVDLSVFSREQKIYLALWRKAVRDGLEHNLPPVSILLSSKSTALAVRTGMYRAIKPFREEKMFDPELKLASDRFVLTTSREGDTEKYRVTLTERRSLIEVEAQLAELGIREADLMTSEERETLERLTEFLGTPEELETTTEFYKRD